MFDTVDQLKEKLDAHRPLPAGLVKNLRDFFRIEWIYHSNAIEGNTLSLLETKVVVEERITIGGKKLNEHLEAVNHAEAIDFVEELVAKQEPLTESVIKQLHYLVLKGINDGNAGRYRSYNVRISGSVHQPVHFLHVQEKMNQLLEWYEKNKAVLHPVELAARFHFQLVSIHPFADGNGRTARLVMNLILMQHGYPPAIVKTDSRLDYYEALEKAMVEGNEESFILLIISCVEESLKQYLYALGYDEKKECRTDTNIQKPIQNLSRPKRRILRNTVRSDLRPHTKINVLEGFQPILDEINKVLSSLHHK
ncbi:Fic family protein [Saccharococcus thermophilus]|uniref:Fic family protein n=1 Tax=Saccharococcus thermophilus TaxID=29396 RepID=A0A846MJW4_9BACL|nr:Fic family protein [Saccharococcus thermophilus]